jgi:hypothetical protein
MPKLTKQRKNASKTAGKPNVVRKKKKVTFRADLCEYPHSAITLLFQRARITPKPLKGILKNKSV